MNPFIQSTILGIVEGLTEFLPVSSTAHLRITEAFMHIPLNSSVCAVSDVGCTQGVSYWEMYTIVIQLGAILALLLLFLGRIAEFFRTFPQGEEGDRNLFNNPITLTFVAFACTSVLALALRKWSEKNLGSVAAMAWALVIGGVVMWAVDAWAARRDPDTTDVEQMTFLQAVWIGLCQALSAIFPGTSRSMSTIAAGQLSDLTRPAALEFSFLLSIPTMLAATGWDLVHEVRHHAGAAAHVVMTPERWGILILGTVVSFIVALGVVEWFLMWVRRHGFTLFAVWRILLGVWLLAWGAKYIAS